MDTQEDGGGGEKVKQYGRAVNLRRYPRESNMRISVWIGGCVLPTRKNRHSKVSADNVVHRGRRRTSQRRGNYICAARSGADKGANFGTVHGRSFAQKRQPHLDRPESSRWPRRARTRASERTRKRQSSSPPRSPAPWSSSTPPWPA